MQSFSITAARAQCIYSIHTHKMRNELDYFQRHGKQVAAHDDSVDNTMLVNHHQMSL